MKLAFLLFVSCTSTYAQKGQITSKIVATRNCPSSDLECMLDSIDKDLDERARNHKFKNHNAYKRELIGLMSKMLKRQGHLGNRILSMSQQCSPKKTKQVIVKVVKIVKELIGKAKEGIMDEIGAVCDGPALRPSATTDENISLEDTENSGGKPDTKAPINNGNTDDEIDFG